MFNWGWGDKNSVEGRRFQPTLKRSACRRAFQVCGVQMMVAGAKSDTDRTVCTMKSCSYMCCEVFGFFPAGRGGRECLKVGLLVWDGGWGYGEQAVVKNHAWCLYC